MIENKFKMGIRRALFNKNLKMAISDYGKTYFQIERSTGISKSKMCRLMNFKYCPTENEKIALAVFLKIPIDDIFPEKYDDLYAMVSPLRREVFVEMDLLRLSSPDVLALEAPDDMVIDLSDKLEVEQLLSILPPRQSKVIRLLYGLDEGGLTRSVEEVATEMSVSTGRIRQLGGVAFERMRLYDDKKKYPQFYK